MPTPYGRRSESCQGQVDKAPKCTTGHDASPMGFMTPNAKRQHSGKPADATPLANDLSGTLVYTGFDMMPSIKEANPAMRLCAARQRVRCNCPRGSSCKIIHDLDITKWPDATFAKWLALVDQSPGLDWNQKSLTPSKSLHSPPSSPHPRLPVRQPPRLSRKN